MKLTQTLTQDTLMNWILNNPVIFITMIIGIIAFFMLFYAIGKANQTDFACQQCQRNIAFNRTYIRPGSTQPPHVRSARITLGLVREAVERGEKADTSPQIIDAIRSAEYFLKMALLEFKTPTPAPIVTPESSVHMHFKSTETTTSTNK